MKKLLFSLFLLIIVFVSAQNDNCTGAINLPIGTDFESNAVTSTNEGATTSGPTSACQANAVNNVWFKVVVPASGKLRIETRGISSSLFEDSVLTVYSGTCSSLTEISCDDNSGTGDFSLISLTGQTPGTTLYISVWKSDSSIDSGEFKISAYDIIPLANDNCSQATSLTIGTDFNSGAITVNNYEATIDGSLPSCAPDATDNIWFKVVVPASGKFKLELQEVFGSPFDTTALSIYSGICGSLMEVKCDDAIFPLISMTGLAPGTTLYISVWKYDSNIASGEFKISAYDNSTLSTHEVADNKKKITVFPNPFSDVLTISDINDVKSISVTDISGKLIKTIEKPSSSLDMRDLEDGLYFVTLKMKDESIKTIKTIKK